MPTSPFAKHTFWHETPRLARGFVPKGVSRGRLLGLEVFVSGAKRREDAVGDEPDPNRPDSQRTHRGSQQ